MTDSAHAPVPATRERFLLIRAARRMTETGLFVHLMTLLRPSWRQIVTFTLITMLIPLTVAAQPALLRLGLDRGVIAGERSVLAQVCGVLLAIGMLRVLLTQRAGVKSAILSNEIADRARVALFQAFEQQDLGFFREARAGIVASRVMNDTARLQSLFSKIVPTAVGSTVQLVATLLVVTLFNWRLGGVLAGFLVMLVGVRSYAARLSKIAYAEMEAFAAAQSHVQERLNAEGASVVRLVGDRNREVMSFAGLSRSLATMSISAARIVVGGATVLGVVSTLALCAITLIGGWFAIGGQMSVGTFVALLFYAAQIAPPVSQLALLRLDASQFMSAMARVGEALDLVASDAAAESADATCAVSSSGPALVTEDVWFRYPPTTAATTSFAKTPTQTSEDSRWVLQSVSLTLDAGQPVAIVGASGAGKTTLAYLLVGLEQPTCGGVTVDTRPLANLRMRERQRAVGYVGPSPYFFNDTIRNNLLLGAEGSDETLRLACDVAELKEAIARLRHDLDTVIGDHGEKLSAGEQQRLAVARALIHRPRFLLMDEALANVEENTEAKIHANLSRSMPEVTTLVISHRPGVLARAERVLLVQDGRVSERDDLLSSHLRHAFPVPETR